MAQPISSDEAKDLILETERLENEKRADQEEQGKDFVNNGQGVIPEDVWQNLPGKKEAGQ